VPHHRDATTHQAINHHKGFRFSPLSASRPPPAVSLRNPWRLPPQLIRPALNSFQEADRRSAAVADRALGSGPGPRRGVWVNHFSRDVTGEGGG